MLKLSEPPVVILGRSVKATERYLSNVSKWPAPPRREAELGHPQPPYRVHGCVNCHPSLWSSVSGSHCGIPGP